MLQNSGDTQKLFAKSVPVTIKDGNTNQCRNCKLFLTVEWKESSAAVHRQELLISLTDSNDPFFLYHLQLSEEDFQVLKSSQGLLVDFTAFPQKFIDLLEISLSEENKPTPKFLLIFNTNEKIGGIAAASQLDVVEPNPFKHLIHLSLKFIAATDSAVKQYLALTLKTLKEEKHQLQSKLSYLEQDSRSRLTSSQAAFEQKSQELEQLRNELSRQMTLKEAQHARELQEERDKFLTRQRENDLKHENERKEKDYSHSRDIQRLEARVSCLDTLNKELNDQNRKLDATIQELKSSISSLEEECRRGKAYIHDFKDKNHKLQSELKEKATEISQHKLKIEELEGNASYLKEMLNKLQGQYEINRQHEKTMEQEFSELQNEYDESKKIIKRLKKDIEKANEVIEKLQGQIYDTHTELKEVNSHNAELERVISKKDKSIRMLQKEMEDLKHILTRKNDDMDDLSHSIVSLKETIKAQEKEIKSRDQVVTYLNRLIYDNGIIPQYMPSSNQGQYVPINEKRYSAGDADVIDRGRSPLAAVAEKPKPFSGRNGSNALQNNARSSPTHIPFDPEYASSSNTKTTSKGLNTNSNEGLFELDPAALSAAFGSGTAPKHSTAKKPVSTRTTNNVRGRCKK